MKTISGIEFASEHNGTDVFRVIELAYEQGQKDVIEQLSSAHGTNLAEVGTDCISRQSAIDAFDTNIDELVVAGKENADAVERYLNRVIDEIKQLPPIQPEIIRCKDCKHFEYDHPYIIQGIPVLGHEVCNAWGDGCKTDENGYCFMAERRTDERSNQQTGGD